MLVDIKHIIRSIGAELTINTETSPEEMSCSFQDYRLMRPLVFRGTLHADSDETLHLDGRIQTQYAGECARCLETVDVEVDQVLSEVYKPLKTEGPGEEDDSYRYEGAVLDISQAIRDNLVLAMPQRLLCREDCKGICSECGSNLNELDCGHGGNRESISRFDMLKDLL